MTLLNTPPSWVKLATSIAPVPKASASGEGGERHVMPEVGS